MSYKVITTAAAILAAALLLAPLPAVAQPWNVGDLFLGVGVPGYPPDPDTGDPGDPGFAPGRYFIYTELGTPIATTGSPLVDVTADPSSPLWNPLAGYATGCVIDPFTDTFWGTTFWGARILGFRPGVTAPTVIDLRPQLGPVWSDYPSGVESLALGVEKGANPDGTDRRVLYAGTIDRAASTAGPTTPLQVLFKYDVTNPAAPALLETFELPRAARGVDWIDLSFDGKTVFYTSEDSDPAAIHAFDLATRTAGPPIVIKIDDGSGGRTPFGGNITYALRVLPPGDGTGGFLVANEMGLFRLNRFGDVLKTWSHRLGAGERTPGYFSLNITPGGTQFWTAQLLNTQDVPQIYLYDILNNPMDAEGYAIPRRTVRPGGPIIAGVCIQLESTAFLGCPQFNPDGSVKRNAAGHPVYGACPALDAEVCGNGGDDDLDGLVDATCPRNHVEGDSVPPFTVVDPRIVPGATISVQVTRPDGTPAALPAGITLELDSNGKPTGRLGGTLTYESAGVYRVKVIVSYTVSGDPQLRTASDEFTWTVANVNRLPVITHFAFASLGDEATDVTVSQGPLPEPIVIAVSDPDGDAVTVQVSNLPPAVVFDSTMLTLTGAIPYDYLPGTVPDSIATATDSHGATATRPLHWNILDVAMPPVVTAPVDTTVVTGTALSLQIQATDPDGDVWTPLALGGVPGLALTEVPVSGEPQSAWFISGIAPAEGVYPISFAVTDGNQPASTPHTFLLRVNAANRPPACPAGESLGALWPPNHKLMSFTLPAPSDPDGDAPGVAIAVTQDEPTQTAGDGNTRQDAYIAGLRVSLRAERAGTPKQPGNGRVYTIVMTATDAASASCSATWTAAVPHDRARPAIDDGAVVRFNSVTGQRVLP